MFISTVNTIDYLIAGIRTFAFSSSSIPSVYPYHPYLPILSVSVSVFPCLHLQASFKITLERSCLESPDRVVSYPLTRHGHTHIKREIRRLRLTITHYLLPIADFKKKTLQITLILINGAGQKCVK